MEFLFPKQADNSPSKNICIILFFRIWRTDIENVRAAKKVLEEL